MTDIVRLGSIAVLAALCAVIVKKNTKELGVVLALTAVTLLLSQVIGELESIRELMDSLADTAGISEAILSPVIKTVGIAIVTKLAVDLCRDAGESGIASVMETVGAITALWVSVPLVKTVLSMITGLL